MYKHMLYFLVSAAVLLLVIPAQAVEQVLYNFCSLPNCQDGANPASDLVLDGSGNVWGTAQNGGHYGFGTIFELTASSGFTALGVVYSFRGGSDGANPEAGLVFDSANGSLYGTTVHGGGSAAACSGGCGTVFSLNTATAGYQTLYRFSGAPSDGANPTAELLLDSAGDLYGTTANGGTVAANCNLGCGTVFLLPPNSGSDQVLHNFVGTADGANPASGLTFDGQGNLWGTAVNGGAKGFGTVFELTVPSFTLGLVHSFNGTTAANPAAALIFDSEDIDGGYLYGTTRAGGSKKCAGGCGTVFQLLPSTSAFKILHDFSSTDGAAPVGRLALETDATNANYGSLYGTASRGGDTAGVCGTAGCGTAFEVCPPTQSCTWRETTLFKFDGVDGSNPSAGFLLFPTQGDPDGINDGINPFQTGRGGCSSNCVASTQQGGTNSAGTVIKIGP